MVRIGIVGYSGAKFDEWKARNILMSIFEDIINKYRDGVEIVSGGTMYGIPKLAYYIAALLGYECVGVICKEGLQDKLFPTLKDLIVEGEHWGDESEAFINYIDILYRVGGGPQSLKEVQMAKTKGIPVYEYELDTMQ